MKNQPELFLSFLLFAFFSTTGFSQDILWEKSYGGKQADYLMDAQPTADTKIVVGALDNGLFIENTQFIYSCINFDRFRKAMTINLI